MRFLLFLGLILGLAACQPVGVTASKLDPTEIYAARPDEGFVVPALPVDRVPAAFRRQIVDYPGDLAPGTIVINPADKFLFLTLGQGQALRYGIAVGKDGYLWSGEAVIASRRTWPSWTPPPEMIARRPELTKWKDGQPGGLDNPLGARALYLTSNGVDYGYRIHGTPEWQSIGQNASSGCIRMINQDVMDLYTRVPDGARVIVMTADGQMPKGLRIPTLSHPEPVPTAPAQPSRTNPAGGPQ